ncbi:hypothetical protein D3C72_2373950 [compost metagenome]
MTRAATARATSRPRSRLITVNAPFIGSYWSLAASAACSGWTVAPRGGSIGLRMPAAISTARPSAIGLTAAVFG